MKKLFVPLIFLFACLGFLDASYLTWEHYANTLPPCSDHWWVDCDAVLTSSYSVMWGVPVALLGMVQYVVVAGLAATLASGLLAPTLRQKISWWLLVQASAGLIFSLYFVVLQLFVLHAICLYCMVSAVISFSIFFFTWSFVTDKYTFFLWILAIKYQVLKRFLFLIDPEIIHEYMVKFGEQLGSFKLVQRITAFLFKPPYLTLSQKIAGISFATPIGLSAGFDYEARLTQILHSMGFGFQTIGTISNLYWGGNPKPRLGRLPQSKALLVNKGFKNPGAKAVIEKLNPLTFHNPVGISIGQTNNGQFTTLTEVIQDIMAAFRHFEKSHVKHAYYELNISCPNLQTALNFYNPKNLELLLQAIDKLKLQRPVFVKMPISETDETIVALLQVIVRHSPVGVIIGNLQKNRLDPSVVPSERVGLGRGNLSGKPTFRRSNHLIALAYREVHPRLIIIGCGGVFTPEDAYQKIQLGASLIQLITGMIFQGPQVIAQINQGLSELVARDGYQNLSQAIGTQNKQYFKSLKPTKR